MNAGRGTILVVEDEPEIRRFLRTSLASEGYRVVEAETGERGATDAGTHKPDLAIVDLGLPDIDGVKVIRRIREWSPMPIIVLSARAQERSKVEALDAGADDYITKPFAIDELLARIRAVTRRALAAADTGAAITFGENTVDLGARVITRDGADVRLSPTEWRLLEYLLRHPGKLLSQRALLHDVWGPQYLTETNYLRQYMARLRRKLETDPAHPQHLLTEPGMGYRFRP